MSWTKKKRRKKKAYSQAKKKKKISPSYIFYNVAKFIYGHIRDQPYMIVQ